jgi:lysyl-tRNA synthetase class 2
MLEWYRLGFNYHQLMQEVGELLTIILSTGSNNSTRITSQFVSYQRLFLEVLGINPHIANTSELQVCMDNNKIEVMGELDHSAMLDILMTQCIEPSFAKQSLIFVYDYPAQQKALAQLSKGSEDSKDEITVAQRFEVYFGSIELGNGYQELTDAQKNADVLQSDQRTRVAKGMADIPIDERFLAAMQQGLPYCSGVAIGLDRLLMCQLGKKKIQEVISFPWTVA